MPRVTLLMLLTRHPSARLPREMMFSRLWIALPLVWMLRHAPVRKPRALPLRALPPATPLPPATQSTQWDVL